MDANGRIIWMICVPPFWKQALRITTFVGQPVAFIRRRALSEPMLDETYQFAMDYELRLRLERGSRVFRLIPRMLAFTHVRTPKAEILKRQLFSWRKAWPRDYRQP